MSVIVSLEAENIKRLKAVSITPSGELVCIGGENAQGKSSLLDSIEMALNGKGSIPHEPIRRGEEHARVVLSLDDGTVVERTFSAKGTYLTVRKADGEKVGTPQALLDSLVSKVAFDPLAFMRAKPTEQANQLRTLVNLDFRAQDEIRQKAYDKRTEVNREIKKASASLEAMPKVELVQPVSVAELMTELKRLQGENQATELAQKKLAENQVKLQNFANQLAAKNNEIEKLQAEADALTANIEKGIAWIEAEKKRVAALPIHKTESIEKQIQDSELINSQVRAGQQRLEIEAQAANKQKEADLLSEQIKSIDESKRLAMEVAKWPIDGLGFDDTGVTFKGLPINQASSAEQLRISTAIGLAFNPSIKVLLIRDGSLLDSNSLKIVGELAAKHKAQVWIERVGHGQECQVIIEDGVVLGAPAIIKQEKQKADISGLVAEETNQLDTMDWS